MFRAAAHQAADRLLNSSARTEVYSTTPPSGGSMAIAGKALWRDAACGGSERPSRIGRLRGTSRVPCHAGRIRMCALHAQPRGWATWAGWWVMTHFVSSLDFRAWYTLRMLYSIGHALPIFLIVLGLIAFRLIWPNPLADKVTIRYLPKSWQRWLLDKPRSSVEKSR